MIEARLAWARGGDAVIVSIDADAVSLRSSVPWPPGARVEGTLAFEPRAVLRVKVHGCRKQPDGAYTIDGRAIDLARPVRAAIEAIVRA